MEGSLPAWFGRFQIQMQRFHRGRDWLPTPVMTSPAAMPAVNAGPPCCASATRIPWVFSGSSCTSAASWAVRSCPTIPRKAPLVRDGCWLVSGRA